MAKLIDRQALAIWRVDPLTFDNPEYAHGWNYAVEQVEKAPVVDAVPVVHGRWTNEDIIAERPGYGVRYYRHAECDVNPCRLIEEMTYYCPFCGAKMDGGAGE